MTSATWDVTNFSDDKYNNPLNWNDSTIPGSTDTAFFGTSNQTSVSITTDNKVGTWMFNKDAENYSFNIGFVRLEFYLAGIVINGGSVHITNSGMLSFFNNSTAGNAVITNTHDLFFLDGSTAGNATIFSGDGSLFTNVLAFAGDSTAGNATITNNRKVVFQERATGGAATINNNAGGTVDFSQSSGPFGDNKLTVGSIAGAGTYVLGADQLKVLSGDVSGAMDDGISPAVGGSLVKVGHSTLTLSGAGNTYSGGTTLEGGTFDVARLGAAGTGAIAFAGRATLKVENTALSSHVFATNPIDFFAKHDVLDLTGLHFHAGAKATYHKASHHLTVHSGGVTDTLTLLSPHGTHFETASDHHLGTDVFLMFA